jgi:tetratricopeptide (TPR) repeat protein
MLLNCIGQPEKALEIALQRSFHPWEGGEGSVAEHYANAHWLLGRKALKLGKAALALEHFQAGLEFPDNLGEIPWDSEVVHLTYSKGLALEALERKDEAKQSYEKILSIKDDLSPAIFYQGLALQQLGRLEESQARLKALLDKAEKLSQDPPGPNYFYYGNPSPVFEDDPKMLQKIYYTYLAGLARLGLGDRMGARSALGQVLALDPTRLIAHEYYQTL